MASKGADTVWFLPSALSVNVVSLSQAGVNGGSDCAQGSQTPRRLIADAHAWIDEMPSVPIAIQRSHSQGSGPGMMSWERRPC